VPPAKGKEKGKRPSATDGLETGQTQCQRGSAFRRGAFGLDGGFVPFELFLTAVAFDGFIILLAHIVLYFVRGLRFRDGTMKCCALRFNLYLLLLAAWAAAAGCKTGGSSDKPDAALRIHIEAQAQMPGEGQTVSVLRANPVLVKINPEPILTEANVVAASLIETPGGFAVEVKFDETGMWTLEQYTSANPGRHLVIFGEWSDNPKDSRWLAAPLITRRIASGVLSFTPDASRQEAQQLVNGLNNVAKKMAKAS
jgi:hypothetical protein